jgi:hypothetical protein
MGSAMTGFFRHGRVYPGHPRSLVGFKDVDTRDVQREDGLRAIARA